MFPLNWEQNSLFFFILPPRPVRTEGVRHRDTGYSRFPDISCAVYVAEQLGGKEMVHCKSQINPAWVFEYKLTQTEQIFAHVCFAPVMCRVGR